MGNSGARRLEPELLFVSLNSPESFTRAVSPRLQGVDRTEGTVHLRTQPPRREIDLMTVPDVAAVAPHEQQGDLHDDRARAIAGSGAGLGGGCSIRRARSARLAAPEVHAIAGEVKPMSVTVRPYQNERWLGGGHHRPAARRVAASRAAAAVDGRRSRRRNDGARTGSGICCCTARPNQRRRCPRLQEFAPRFLDGHARANRQKPSGIAAKETILNVHLVPLLGDKKLDAITNEDVQRSEARAAATRRRRPSTTC